MKLDEPKSKIALLAFQYQKCLSSFGAVMQLWASSKFLAMHGFQADIINYIPNSSSAFTGTEPNSFDVFRSRFLPNMTAICNDFFDLEKLNDEYKIFITGSDQVWRNWGDPNELYVYMLNFVNEENKKIALSVSFGHDVWAESPDITCEAKRLIKRFDYVSCREKSGAEILKNVFNMPDVPVLLDPTLLLEEADYKEIYECAVCCDIDNSYILKLSIRSDDNMKQILEVLSKSVNGKVIDGLKKDLPEKVITGKVKQKNLFKRIFKGHYKYIYENNYSINSVPDWMHYIKNAALVVTDSYHGLMFSIIFKKNFICLANDYGGVARFKSFLEMFNLEDRLIYSVEDLKHINLNPIDYKDVYIKLDKMKNISRKFLLDAINSLGKDCCEKRS